MKNRLNKPQFFLALLMLFLLAACRHNGVYTHVLSQADSVMSVHPDSALHLLESIEEPQAMDKANRARYALLMTQARDKNWITMANDSLIQVAVEYYKDRQDKEQAAKAYYYLGCVYEDMEDIAEAATAYLQALKLMPKKVKDTELLAMTYESLARCNTRQGFYDKALEMYRMPYNTNLIDNSSEQMLFSLYGMAETFMGQQHWDSAAYYCNQIIEKSRVIGDSSWVSVAFHGLADIYYYQEKYQEAYQAVVKSIHKQNGEKVGNEKDGVDNYILISEIFIELEQYDSARYYLSLCDTVQDIYTRALGNLTLYELEKSCGRYKEAVVYNDTFQMLYDSIQMGKRKKEVAKLMNDYTIERYKKEIEERQELKARILIYSFVFLVVVGILAFLLIDRHRKRKYMDLQHSLMIKRGEMLKVQSQLDSLDASKLLNQELAQEKENKKEALRKLQKEKFQYNVQLFKQTPYYNVLQELEAKRILEGKVFTATERDLLGDCIYQTFADTMSDLKNQCPELTHDDVLYCVFYLLRYSNPVIIACTGTNANALKTRKNRLKRKMDDELCTYVLGEEK